MDKTTIPFLTPSYINAPQIAKFAPTILQHEAKGATARYVTMDSA